MRGKAATGPGDEPSDGGDLSGEARLTQLIEDGAAEWVSLFLARMPQEELVGLAPGIVARRRRGVPQAQRIAMWVAGASCLTAPDAVARWVASPTLAAPDADGIVLLRVLRSRAPHWQREVAGRIAERLPPRAPGNAAWQVCYGLTVFSAAPAPQSVGFLHGWIKAGTEAPERDIRFLLGRNGWAEPPCGPLLIERLRVDPLLNAMAARMFEIEGIGALLRRDAGGWPDALARLAAAGRIEYSTLFDSCLARLERAEKPQHLRGIVDVLDALDPSPEECAVRTGTYARLLTEGPRIAGEYAQRVLRMVDRARLLDSDVVLGTSRAVMQRSEHKLPLRQLGWLDKHARSHPGQAGHCAAVAALGLRHTGHTVRERAAAVVMNHIGALSQAELDGLLEIVRDADPGTRSRLGPHLTVHDAVPGHASIAESINDAVPVVALPRYQLAPMLDPLDDPLAVAEEFRAALSADWVDSPHLERLLAAVVALAGSDQAALAAALRPVRRDLVPDPSGRADGSVFRTALLSLLVVCDTPAPATLQEELLARSRVRPEDLWFAPDEILHSRLWEVVLHLGREPVPCLLSTPTEAAGLLDPFVLVERLQRYEAAAATVWSKDLDQALLRLPGTITGDAVAAARELAPPMGKIVMHWINSRLHVVTPPPTTRRRLVRTRQLLGRARGAAAESGKTRRGAVSTHYLEFPTLLERTSSLKTRPFAAEAFRPAWSAATMVHWPAIVPARPDRIAAHALTPLRDQTWNGRSGAAQMLPTLAQAFATFGSNSYKALLFGLAARAAEDRDAAARAFVVLASRGQLDTGELGRQFGLATNLSRDRILHALGAAARAGAHEQVSAVLAEAGKSRPAIKR